MSVDNTLSRRPMHICIFASHIYAGVYSMQNTMLVVGWGGRLERSPGKIIKIKGEKMRKVKG